MCTLVLARDVVAPGSLLIATNRDEDPARPSSGPTVLQDAPRIVGGRDLVAGGTWLAVRGGAEPMVAALLNRRPGPDAVPGRRSRGELPLLVTRAGDARAAAWEAARSGDFAPCTLLVASARACWRLAIPADGPPRLDDIAPGWHVLTHTELDDPLEPRAHFLLERLRHWHPPTRHEAVGRVRALLAGHGDATHPAVCLHEGRMQTVSAAHVWLSDEGVHYEHLEGRPCTATFTDHTALLVGATTGGRA